MNTDQIIELHVKVHSAMLTMLSGTPATESEARHFRESLQGLVKLARLEFAENLAKDMNQAMSSIYGKS